MDAPFTAGSLNLGHASTSRVVADLGNLARHGATVLGLQEAGDREDALRQFVRQRPSWRLYRPPAPVGAPSVPIAYDSASWTRARARTLLAVVGMWVGAVGAGPTRAKPRVLNIVVLRHRKHRQRVKFINTHLLASITRTNLPAREEAARARNAREHLRVLLRVVARTRLPLVLMGDFNAPTGHSILEPLARAGLRGWSTEGTHGKRPIDHVLSQGLQRLDTQVLPTSSDHDAVLATLALR